MDAVSRNEKRGNGITRRGFIRAAALTFAAKAATPVLASGKKLPEKPNVVFIMSDDMGYETLSYNNVTNYCTPNLDKLAQESLVFTQADSMPLCVPTRKRVVSGQYIYRSGWHFGKHTEGVPTLADIMKSAGYATGAFGKWHLGDPKRDKRGFEDTCLFMQKGSQARLMKIAYRNSPYLHNGKVESSSYGPDLPNKYALEFIEKHKKGPFFLYYTPWLSHNPFYPTPDSKNQESTDWQSNFEDMVAYTDKLVGKVIQKLKDCGIYENTIIVYTSDNGTKTCAHHMKDGSVIYGGKGTPTVDGCRVPLLVKSDGSHKTVDNLVDFADFYPTFAELAGIPAKSIHEEIDGISFVPLLRGEEKEVRPYIVSYYRPLFYIRTKRFKYFIDQRVYDIEADPREHHPFYPENDTEQTAEARKKLTLALNSFLDSPKYAEADGKKSVAGLRSKYSGKLSQWMLGAKHFDKITKKPRSVTWSFDITPFAGSLGSSCRVSFSRSHETTNSHMIYSDAAIKKVTLSCDGKVLQSVMPKGANLTTRYKGNVINPLVDFDYNESGASVELGGLSIPSDHDKVTLSIEADLSNPGNQWGDRILLYTYLSNSSGRQRKP